MGRNDYRKDVPGLIFNRLRVLKETRDADGRFRWKCACDCGVEIAVRWSDLRSGKVQSCGCLARENTTTRNTRHGLSHTPVSKTYQGIITRCTNPNHKDFASYGARGVRVAEEWLGEGGLERFAQHVGPKPSPNHSIDRYPDAGGDYVPGNVRWATAKEQQRNKRNNRLVTLNGRTQPVAAWAEELGIELRLVWNQIRIGKSAEQALLSVAPNPPRG